MMQLLKTIWNWIKRLFGGDDDPKAVRIIDKKLCVPLFYFDGDGDIESTWGYLAMSAAEQKRCRQNITQVTVSGEVPAIAFLLSPNGAGGNLFVNDNNPSAGINVENVKRAVEAMRELCREGIAVLVTCYTDDAPPRWNDAPAHASGWSQLWGYISPYVSAVLLSIESTERGNYLAVQHCVETLQVAMPGAQAYGTHQQWGVKWSGPSDTPANCTMLLVETTNHPGQNPGIDRLKRETEAVIRAAGAQRIVMHEYYFTPTDEMRAWLRRQNLWGVG